jgi:preprotein translocase subunit SecF
MILRAIGVTIGGLVTLILLVIMVPGTGATWQDFITPLVIGNVAAFFWPVVIAFYLGRRVKQRRENEIEAEVQRQLDQQNRG